MVGKRLLIAGFLAGASAVFAALFALTFVFVSGGLIELIYGTSVAVGLDREAPFWQLLGQSVMESFAATPLLLWSARFGFLAVGALGVVFALVESQAGRLRYERPLLLSLVIAGGLGGGAGVLAQYINRESLLAAMPDQPGLFNQRESVQQSDPALIATGLLIGLPIAYVVWALWRWWFTRWSRWLRVPGAPSEQPEEEAPRDEPAPPEEDMLARQERLFRAKRGEDDPRRAAVVAQAEQPAERRSGRLRALLIALAATSLLVPAALAFYHTVAGEVVGGNLWVSPESRQDGIAIRFTRAPQRLTVYNVIGEGEIALTLGSSAAGGEPLAREQMTLANQTEDEPYRIVDLPVSGRAPDSYQLTVQLLEGAGGGLGYIALQGGGLAAQVAAAAIALAGGVWLMAAILAFLEGFGARRRGRAF